MNAFQREAPAQHDDIDGVPSPAETPVVLGHDEARADLIAGERSGRLHHAWLIQGSRGIGKACVAYEFARRLLVPEQETAEGRSALRQIAQGAHPGLMHLARPLGDQGSFRTQITVEEVRRLAHFFHTTAGGRWRVAIVDPVDDMNRNAANALLKILEEPPPRSIFLLTNHQPGRILPTIRSRCRLLRLAPLEPPLVEQILAHGAGEESGQARADAAARCEGSARAAYQMLLGGGLELSVEIERLFQRPSQWTAVQKLADALAQKGREASFDAMAGELFRLLSREAETLLSQGHGAASTEAADFWFEEQRRWREALAYNLDRRQLVLTFFVGLDRLRAARDRTR